ncbi:helix-turn-helix domain-containing protein [Streptomyces sp. NPDC088812]|uniref:helix-turn-helix domain-containing protein n=1 Tax=Streptomyces sp. NPDC088812 TaxID=3365905 RepID=UPI0037F40E8B
MHALPDDDSWIADHRRAIGDAIRRERLHQNRTQDDVWLCAGISRYTLQRAEGGQDVTLSTLLRIARALNVPLSHLVEAE